MEIKINSLADINEAAKQFIANMGNGKVLLSTARWEPERPPSSRLYVRKWAWRT